MRATIMATTSARWREGRAAISRSRPSLRNAMQSFHDMEAEHVRISHTEHAELLAEVRALRADLQALKSERGSG